MEFEQWWRDHQGWLMRLATVLCGPNEAEDIAQDVAIKASRRWDTIKDLDHPQAYVRRMIVNEHVSFRRRFARVVVREQIEVPPSAGPADAHADRDLLASEIRRLPPKQRAVVVLRYVEDLDDAAIAATLGCGQSTVRSHATRAMAALRVQIDATNQTGARDALATRLEKDSEATGHAH